MNSHVVELKKMTHVQVQLPGCSLLPTSSIKIKITSPIAPEVLVGALDWLREVRSALISANELSRSPPAANRTVETAPAMRPSSTMKIKAE